MTIDSAAWSKHARELLRILPNVRCGIEAKQLTTWRIGGPVAVLVEPASVLETKGVVQYCADNQLSRVTIGRASNLLFCDEGVNAVIMRLGNLFSTVRRNGRDVYADAGVFMPCLVRKLSTWGLTGLEHAIGIPGTVGGLAVMNGGSQRHSISETILRVYAIREDGRELVIEGNECGYAYRTSAFQTNSLIVTGVDFRLALCTPFSRHPELIETLSKRRHKFPLKQPNCGSVFVSDADLYEQWGPPGKIIDALGMKGKCIGDAQISEQHANFIINRGNATATEVMHLIRHVRERVKTATSYRLKTEVKWVNSSGLVREI